MLPIIKVIHVHDAMAMYWVGQECTTTDMLYIRGIRYKQ